MYSYTYSLLIVMIFSVLSHAKGSRSFLNTIEGAHGSSSSFYQLRDVQYSYERFNQSGQLLHKASHRMLFKGEQVQLTNIKTYNLNHQSVNLINENEAMYFLFALPYKLKDAKVKKYIKLDDLSFRVVYEDQSEWVVSIHQKTGEIDCIVSQQHQHKICFTHQKIHHITVPMMRIWYNIKEPKKIVMIEKLKDFIFWNDFDSFGLK